MLSYSGETRMIHPASRRQACRRRVLRAARYVPVSIPVAYMTASFTTLLLNDAPAYTLIVWGYGGAVGLTLAVSLCLALDHALRSGGTGSAAAINAAADLRARLTPGQTVRVQDLLYKLPWRLNTIRLATARLIADGHLTSTGRGRWRVTEAIVTRQIDDAIAEINDAYRVEWVDDPGTDRR